MKKKLYALSISLLIIFVILACEIYPTPATTVPATDTLPPGVTPSETPTTFAVVTDTPIPSPTFTPLPPCLPAHPGAQSLALPAGVAAGLQETLSFYNVQGNLLGTRTLSGMTWADADQVHIAGTQGMGINTIPILYYTLQNGGTIRSNVNNVTTDLVSAPDLMAVRGGEGNPFLSYVTIDWFNAWTNRVYAEGVAVLPGAPPRYTWVPPADGHIGNAIQPLAVRSTAGTGNGLWYTYTMEGIGNINFPPYNGLYYLDLATNQPTEFLPPGDALGGVSPNQARIAYGPGQGGAPGVIFNGFYVKDLLTCGQTYIAYNPASNLGGGYMVFSPDNRLVAWIEASGPDNMSASFRLRVARTDGTSLVDSPAASLSGLLGGEAFTYLKPIGWIANHLLVLEIYSPALNQDVLVVWAPDPAQPLDPVLGANQSAPIGTGSFLGFLYP